MKVWVILLLKEVLVEDSAHIEVEAVAFRQEEEETIQTGLEAGEGDNMKIMYLNSVDFMAWIIIVELFNSILLRCLLLSFISLFFYIWECLK